MAKKNWERRRHPRVDLHLPCVLLLQAPTVHPVGYAVGVTKDISRSGLLMHWQSNADRPAPEVGDWLELLLEWPSQPAFGPKPRFVRCHSRVVRILVAGETVLVALEVGQMRFWSPRGALRVEESTRIPVAQRGGRPQSSSSDPQEEKRLARAILQWVF